MGVSKVVLVVVLVTKTKQNLALIAFYFQF